MPLELIIQMFLITSLFVILVVIAKMYYKFTKNVTFIRDSIYLAIMSTSVLIFPVFANSESRLYCLTNPNEILIFSFLSIIALGIIFYFLNRAVIIKELFLDSILALIFKIPDIKTCENEIKEKVPKTRAYSIIEISKLIKINPKTIEKTLNKLALEKKIKITVIENGELEYFIK